MRSFYPARGGDEPLRRAHPGPYPSPRVAPRTAGRAVGRPTALLAALGAVLQLASPARSEEVDLAVIHRIKEEAFRNSQVMDHMFHLSDRFGPRVSGSPAYRDAARWVVETAQGWGLANAALEPWGEWGRGWSLDHFSAHMVEPTYARLPGIPGAWTGSTDGAVTAEVIAAHLYASDEEEAAVRWDLEARAASLRAYAGRNRGQLRGKIVLLERPRDIELPTEPEGTRHDGETLAETAEAPLPRRAPPYTWPLRELPADPKERAALFAWLPLEVMAERWAASQAVWDELYTFLAEEGVVAALQPDDRGSGAIAFMEARGAWKPGSPVAPPIIALPPEPYARLSRLVARQVPVRVALDVRTSFHEEDLDGYNVVAEIRGGSKRREVVMLGGHLDSWHGATGATDNAAGCAVALEAVRILEALDLPLDRTVRLALWGAEEQGLYGSRGYVRKHFADPVTMERTREHARLSGYFNLDNGSGKIRGVYLQSNDMMRPIFQAWLAPFRDLGVDTVSIRGSGGTDHLSFDAVGLPGFQFIQDPLAYPTRTHHSDLDTVDHAIEADLMQAAAVMAAVVYHAANREELLPRKPLPPPLPPRRADE